MYWVERVAHHIKKKLYMNNKMTNQFTDVAFNTARNERPVYINMAASKMSNSVNPNSIVMFKDFMGRTHKVVCRNKPEIKKACEFFSMLKKESAQITRIISQYPMSYGQVTKKFIPEVKRELKGMGLSSKQIENILIMYWA
jgi:hypothetical protein